MNESGIKSRAAYDGARSVAEDKNRYNKLLFGPNDVVNKACPSSTYLWNSQCCCGPDCCWDRCSWQIPPSNCILASIEDDIKWVFNDKLGYFQAYKYEGMGLYPLISGLFQAAYEVP